MAIVGERKKPDATTADRSRIRGASLHVLTLRDELARGLRQVGAFAVGDFAVEVGEGRDSIWAIVRRPGRGGRDRPRPRRGHERARIQVRFA